METEIVDYWQPCFSTALKNPFHLATRLFNSVITTYYRTASLGHVRDGWLARGTIGTHSLQYLGLGEGHAMHMTTGCPIPGLRCISGVCNKDPRLRGGGGTRSGSVLRTEREAKTTTLLAMQLSSSRKMPRQP